MEIDLDKALKNIEHIDKAINKIKTLIDDVKVEIPKLRENVDSSTQSNSVNDTIVLFESCVTNFESFLSQVKDQETNVKDAVVVCQKDKNSTKKLASEGYTIKS